MTQEVLNCLQGERNEEINPSGLRPPPLTQGRLDAEGMETCAQTESATSSAPAGQLPLKGKAKSAGIERAEQTEVDTSSAPAGQLLLREKSAEQSRTESRDGVRLPDVRMLREHLALLQEQAAQIPGFDLKDALRDPAFVRLTAPCVGVSVADALYALHREELEHRRAEEGRELLARAAAASAGRPREGGGSGAALIAADYRSLSRAEQLTIKQRILEASARGEKLYP